MRHSKTLSKAHLALLRAQHRRRSTLRIATFAIRQILSKNDFATLESMTTINRASRVITVLDRGLQQVMQHENQHC
jgi:hypothetical protein